MNKEQPDNPIWVDFRGKRYYAPFRCLCCGVKVSDEQFCYGRTCGYCDCGKCNKNLKKGEIVFEEGHGRKDIINSAMNISELTALTGDSK